MMKKPEIQRPKAEIRIRIPQKPVQQCSANKGETLEVSDFSIWISTFGLRTSDFGLRTSRFALP